MVISDTIWAMKTKYRVYADYAATTPTDKAVVDAMTPYMTDFYGNPSSIHIFGQEAHEAIVKASVIIASYLNCSEEELYYTSSGTESNNMAIIGVAKAMKNIGKHIITSEIEHPSVLNTCKSLEKDGWKVTYLKVNKDGLVNIDDFKKAITKETVFATIHMVNNEIGVIQPIKELAQIANKNKIIFHTDACQALAYIKIDIKDLGVDLLSFNGGKIYGPKGVAVLFIKESTPIFPIIYGGGQQKSLRSGTENVSGIVGISKAIELLDDNLNADVLKVKKYRDCFESELKNIPNVKINIPDSPKVVNLSSVIVGNIDAKSLLEKLNNMGIAISAGAACSAKSQTGSYILKAIGLTDKEANSTIRVSFGRFTTNEDCTIVVNAIKSIVRYKD